MAAALTAQPLNRQTALVDLLNFRPREIRAQNLPVILPGARATNRAPLAHPDGVTRSRTYRHDPVDDAARSPGHRELERGARQRAVWARTQHGATHGTRNAKAAT